jgi:asparagine synthase (glutamine-hydrolysing)
MCGIAGKICFDRAQSVNPITIEAMMAAMHHRGPDGQGMHIDGSVGLGHMRLSIIDLATGAQPLSNEDDTVWITFNGEIYNYQELRADLLSRGHQFKTRSDTEVIVHLFEEYGQDCVRRLRGMFAFAIWDSRNRHLFLARDRVGIKPLYYSHTAEGLVFASEIKSLLTVPEVSRELLPEAVDALWCFRYLPGEITMFRHIKKLLPGHSMDITADGRLNIRQFWDLNFSESDSYGSLQMAAGSLSELLRDTIRMHMISDVPVGFLLSGGVDSSAVLSFAAGETDREISTFTIGFDGDDVIDERPYARLMANQCHSRHYETTITAGDFWSALPHVLYSLEEPICDSATVGLHFVSKMARQHVKVLLSGEGGDEAFGGYPNYPNQLALQRIRVLCGPFRPLAGRCAVVLGSIVGNRRMQGYGRCLPLHLKDYYWSRAGSPFERESGLGGVKYSAEFRDVLPSLQQNPLIGALFNRIAGEPLLNQMLYVDTKTWLPDYLLLKADKVTMGNSLELRVPLLDHKVLEFAASLPADFKVKGRETKRILKDAFSRVLPPAIINRKKVGFPVPHGRWLAGELWEPTRELLLDSGSIVRRYFDIRSVGLLLQRHRTSAEFQREVFSLLALELWHQKFSTVVATSHAKLRG